MKKKHVNVPMFLAGVLFCLTLISIHLTSGLYAKYTVSVSSGDSARVIRFGDLTLTETGSFVDEGKLMIIPGVNLEKKAVVNFQGSESATYIFLEIIPQGWTTTDYYKFTISNESKLLMEWNVEEQWKYLTNQTSGYIYYQQVEPNTVVSNMNVIAEDGKIYVNENMNKQEIENLPKSVSIKIRATVVQSGGFESPEAAWNSIAEKEGV